MPGQKISPELEKQIREIVRSEMSKQIRRSYVKGKSVYVTGKRSL